jgi:hypothetical protein
MSVAVIGGMPSDRASVAESDLVVTVPYAVAIAALFVETPRRPRI